VKNPGEVLLISCYEMGHQPLALASPLGFLEAAGYKPSALDIAVEGFDEERARSARFVGISVPMHTAMRLGILVGERVRAINPGAHICYYGLYASLNAGTLLGKSADSVIGGEFEGPLLELVEAIERGTKTPVPIDGVTGRATNETGELTGIIERRASTLPSLRRLAFQPPARSSLPPLQSYAKLDWKGELRLVGSVETSRGCLHLCRHCPIPPVYGGRFFIVPKQIVLEDVRALVEAGARHISFTDADFLNGPGHSMAVARAIQGNYPDLTFDITTKVEHILRHRKLFPELARLGCLFVISAIESTSDEVLSHLDKGHTRADIAAALGICQGAGITLRPSLLSFTPWTTLADYADMLDFIDRHDLIDQVDPVYYAIRLLLPPGSLLLADPTLAPLLGPLDEAAFSFAWKHPDPRMDRLHREVSRAVERAAASGEDPRITFQRVRLLVHLAHGEGIEKGIPAGGSIGSDLAVSPAPVHPASRRRPPRMTESWFC